MTIEEINEMGNRFDTLTQEEKETLRDGILSNDEARNYAISGALINQDFNLALEIIFMKNKTTCLQQNKQEK